MPLILPFAAVAAAALYPGAAVASPTDAPTDAPADAAPSPAAGADIVVTARAAPVSAAADASYHPTPDASTLRATTPMLDVPQIVNIVPAQVIRDQRPRYLDDVLANVSGITQGNTLASTQDTILKRGFGGNRDGSIQHNGMPLVQGRGFNAAAESVEVLKGPSSLLYGIMDPGGVINIVSKKPQLGRATWLTVTADTYAHGRAGAEETIDTTGPIGGAGLAYRLVVDQDNEAYWRNFGRRRETLVAPSLAWYGGATQIVAWYEYRNYSYPFDRGTALDPSTGRPLAIPRTRRLDEPTNLMAGASHLGQMSIDHRLGHGWAIHASASYNAETYDAGQFRVTGVRPATGILLRSNDATRGALSTDLYATFYVDGTIDWLGLRHAVQFGGEVEHRLIFRRDLLRQATTTAFSYLDPVYGREPTSTRVSPSDSDQTDDLHDQSLFAQDSIHLGRRWIAVLGGRYLHYAQVAGRGRPFVANTDTRNGEFLPRAGLVYKANDRFSAYFSFARSLKPASTIAPLGTGVVLDSGFAPERGRQFELGLKLDVPHGLSGSLAIYDIDKRNVIVAQYNPATALTDYRTAGRARSRGIELDLAGPIGARLSAIGSYAFTDARTTEDPLFAGNALWNVARHTASLSAVCDLGAVGGGRLRIGGGPHYASRRPGDSANSFWLPAYVVADGFATWDTRLGGRKASVQLNVKNMFDRTYYPSSVSLVFVSIGDPRRVSLSLSLAL